MEYVGQVLGRSRSHHWLATHRVFTTRQLARYLLLTFHALPVGLWGLQKNHFAPHLAKAVFQVGKIKLVVTIRFNQWVVQKLCGLFSVRWSWKWTVAWAFWITFDRFSVVFATRHAGNTMSWLSTFSMSVLCYPNQSITDFGLVRLDNTMSDILSPWRSEHSLSAEVRDHIGSRVRSFN